MIDIKKIPENSGVYLMKNKVNKIIYIGKAKNLKKRVASYFTGSHNRKTMELVKNIADIEFFICNNEIEAFILENNLIKKHKPKYNILLKDEKTYPYIKISKENLPRITMTRNKSQDAYYYGPFPNINLKTLIKNLLKVFNVSDCGLNVNKNNKRPCLKYHMGLCNGACYYKDEKTISEYKAQYKKLINFLENKDTSILKELETNMFEYSKNFEYEKAIIEREKIKGFKKLLENQITEITRENDKDIFTIFKNTDALFLCILSVRKGKLISKYFNVFKDLVDDDNIENLVSMFYEKTTIPKIIVLSNDFLNKKEILQNWFKKEKNKSPKIYIPKIKSQNKELLELANTNLISEKEQYYNKVELDISTLERLKETLKLKSLPKRIECFDISNIQGTNPVASMSVAVDGKLKNSCYRHFKITVKETPDDFLMMREALTRRYSKLDIKDLPNVILIDGGKGQIGVAVDVLTKLNKIEYLDILSIAKREEEIFKDTQKIPYIFKRNDEVLKLLQRLRDEAHRFGITHHRKLRSKRVLKSKLDEIEGIGPKRKKALLLKFGTVQNIFNAKLEELLEILPQNIAKNIFSLNN
ncbi:excinuclease ABC subunit UvrC [Oceanivirga salmonicida]|uniref:excinuclease ABC subunit UvrC n=1 Tax=Oceanivirga salmonicida TaxID=1769291 RepID=UPI0012E277E2|nr:excinuclease ABC subunit UvrC [Oceanivirga salmonicida]